MSSDTMDKALAREWNDIRARLSGGKYGKRYVRPQDKTELIRSMILAAERERITSWARLDKKAERAADWRAEVLWEILKDYES